MNHEKIFKRENGIQYQLRINFYFYGPTPVYEARAYIRGKGKRKWKDLPDTLSDWEYRALSMEARRVHVIKNIEKFFAPKEILETKLELWEKLRPV